MEEFRKDKDQIVTEEKCERKDKKRKLEIDGKKMIIFSEILKPKFDE